MVSASRKILQPAAGLTLLVLAAAVCPVPSTAQPLIAQTSTPARINNDSYTLGSGDRIQVDIFNVPEYSGENGRHQVLVDGSLNLPLVGKVSVRGMTLTEAANTLTARYSRYLRRPIISVSLLEAAPLNVAVAGEVISPGSYTMTQEEKAQFPTLTRALQRAGGITQAANIREVQIRRPQRSGSPQVISVDLREFLKTGDLSRDVALRDGDTIVVPTATAIDPSDYELVSDSNIASDQSQPLNILVVGEVQRPGPYTVTPVARTGVAGEVGETAGNTTTSNTTNTTSPGAKGGRTTLTRALQTAGGIKPLADISQVQVRRPTRNGSPQVITIDLMKLLKEGDVRQDITLAQGDTIFVPTRTSPLPANQIASISSSTFSPTSIKVGVVGEAKSPGVVEVPPNTPMNQAILAAGGFDNKRARKATVQLVRQNDDGTATSREIPVDFSKGPDPQINPVMQNNDVIVIGRSGITKAGDSLSNLLSPIGGAFSFLRIFGL